MDFYIIILPVLALSLGMLLNLLILKRRDKYLFAELQQSQDILSVVRENTRHPKKSTIKEQSEAFSKS